MEPVPACGRPAIAFRGFPVPGSRWTCRDAHRTTVSIASRRTLLEASAASVNPTPVASLFPTGRTGTSATSLVPAVDPRVPLRTVSTRSAILSNPTRLHMVGRRWPNEGGRSSEAPRCGTFRPGGAGKQGVDPPVLRVTDRRSVPPAVSSIPGGSGSRRVPVPRPRDRRRPVVPGPRSGGEAGPRPGRRFPGRGTPGDY